VFPFLKIIFFKKIKGFGVPVNNSKALELYTEAAQMHYPDAMYNVGLCYENGTGCNRNLEEAKK
jgi:TPR repeat protein